MATPTDLLRRAALVAAIAVLALPGRVAARPSAPPGARPAEQGAAENGPAAGSPRAAVTEYLALCRADRYAEAARFLTLSEAQAPRGPELARRFKAVLDRHLWIDPAGVSPHPEGDQDDGLAPDLDQLGSLPTAGGRSAPVRLKRAGEGAQRRWAFSTGTVGRIDAWYEALPQRRLREMLPAAAFRTGPLDLLWWQWAALPLLVVLAWVLGRVLGSLTRTIFGRVAARTDAEWDDRLLARLAGPLTLVWALVAAFALLPALGLYAPAEASIRSALRAASVFAFFWALWRGVDVAGAGLQGAAWARDNPSARSLLSIGVRGGKVLVLAMGVVAAVAQLGYPVASLLAGLGIGGIAFALAAQKTVENLFGSVSLGVDQPFHVGDFVKIEDFVGTVEAIGLRSTRFRTLDRTLISIPNGRLADMRLESFTARDRLRLACIIGVLYGTTAEQMRQVLEGFEKVLRAHPKIWPDALVVRFKEFGASSLDIEIMCWFQTSVWPEFQLYRQEVLLQFMEVVERAGTGFAFPTRTVHLVQEPAPAPPPKP